MGTLATGCQAFAAAQCLSEVMAIHGLEADTLPSVDVLKGLVGYLAPFTQGLGFSKVLQHITNLAERVIRHDGKEFPREGESSRTARLLMQLKDVGGAASLAGAIKQLIHTSQRNQRDYMALKTRGSWLPAFASHILGMSVEVRLNRKVVWASGGDHGHCLFQLDDEPSVQSALYPFSNTGGLRVQKGHEEKIQNPLMLDYLLGEALEAQILRRPEIDQNTAASIRRTIRTLSYFLMERMRIQLHSDSFLFNSSQFHSVNDRFQGARALEEVLISMNIGAGQQTVPQRPKYSLELGSPPSIQQARIEYQGLRFLPVEDLIILVNSCHVHQDRFSWKKEFDWEEGMHSRPCLCRTVGRMIHCFAITALALMFCKFNASEVRVQERVIAGDTMTFWSQNLIMVDDTNLFDAVHRTATHRDLFDHLGELICCDYEFEWLGKAGAPARIGESYSILGISGREFTINYACIMEKECFDECGRLFRIQSGRASMAGSFRNVIMEEPMPLRGDIWQWTRPVLDKTIGLVDEIAEPVSLAGQTLLDPC